MKKLLFILVIIGLTLSATTALAKERGSGFIKTPGSRNNDRFENYRGQFISTTSSSSLPKWERVREQRAFVASTTVSTTSNRTLKAEGLRCPPGHFIARGWIKRNGQPTLAEGCRAFPFGISRILNWRFTSTVPATTTPPVATTTTP